MNFYDVSHFLQIWLLPPGSFFILVIIGYFISYFYRSIGKTIIGFAIFSLWLLSTPMIAQPLIDILQNQYSPIKVNEIRNDAAMVVLGSGVENAREYEENHTLSHRSFSRMHYAAYISQKTKLPIIVSGGNRDDYAMTEAELMQRKLETHYQIKTIAMENRSRNTAEEAKMLAPLLLKNNIHCIYLVTNAWHMPRSLYIFRANLTTLNILVMPAPMGYLSLYSNDRIANYLPSLKALTASAYALHEYIGLLWYHLNRI